jgi:hypothetical protein
LPPISQSESAEIGGEIPQIFRGRGYVRKQQMLARPRAGDVKQSTLGFIDVVEFCLVRGVGDADVSGGGRVGPRPDPQRAPTL